MANQIGNSLVIEDDDAPEAELPVKKAEAAKPAPEKEPEEKPEKPEKAEGTEFVDLDDKAKKRFDRIYANMKQFQRDLAASKTREETMAKQLGLAVKRLEELQQTNDSAEVTKRADRLKADAKAALATGDYDASLNALEGIADLRAEEKLKEAKKADEAEEAPSVPDLSEREVSLIARWRDQKTESGEEIRPWARPGHAQYEVVQDMIATIGKSPTFADASVSEVLAEIDRRMARYVGRADEQGDEEEAPRKAFSPPTSNARRTDASKPGPLSDAEKKAAENMFWGGLAKTKTEAHQLYQKQRGLIGRSVVVEE